MIINTGRGQLIHTNALIEGLKNKKIGSAGLDVYEEESEYFYEDQSDKIIDDDTLARLLSFNNVIVTSHRPSSHVKRWQTSPLPLCRISKTL